MPEKSDILLKIDNIIREKIYLMKKQNVSMNINNTVHKN